MQKMFSVYPNKRLGTYKPSVNCQRASTGCLFVCAYAVHWRLFLRFTVHCPAMWCNSLHQCLPIRGWKPACSIRANLKWPTTELIQVLQFKLNLVLSPSCVSLHIAHSFKLKRSKIQNNCLCGHSIITWIVIWYVNTNSYTYSYTYSYTAAH